jgi:hypothetical protein
MSELEQKAAFKFPEITHAFEQLLVAIKEGNEISKDILTSKIDQQIRDNEQHAEYLRQKRKGSWLSIIAIFVGLSGAAISLLTLVATGKSAEIIVIIKEFISSIGGL